MKTVFLSTWDKRILASKTILLKKQRKHCFILGVVYWSTINKNWIKYICISLWIEEVLANFLLVSSFLGKIFSIVNGLWVVDFSIFYLTSWDGSFFFSAFIFPDSDAIFHAIISIHMWVDNFFSFAKNWY